MTEGLFPLWRVRYRSPNGPAHAYVMAPRETIESVARFVEEGYTPVSAELLSEHPIMRGDEHLALSGRVVVGDEDDVIVPMRTRERQAA